MDSRSGKSNPLDYPRPVASLPILPTELLHQITAPLQPHERAALALANRTLLAKLGLSSLHPPGDNDNDDPEAISKAKSTKFKLLALLARDPAMYPHLVPCPACVVFHPPFLPGNFLGGHDRGGRGRGRRSGIRTRDERVIYMRACEGVVRGGDGGEESGSDLDDDEGGEEEEGEEADSNESHALLSPYLPAQCHFNMVAGVMRSWRCGWASDERGGLKAAWMDSGEKMHMDVCETSDVRDMDGGVEGLELVTVSGGKWRIHRYHEFAVRDGRLLVKTERLLGWFPSSRRSGGDNKAEVDNTEVIRYALHKLKSSFEGNQAWSMRDCCRHDTWERYFALWDDPELSWWQTGSGGHESNLCRRRRCVKVHVGDGEIGRVTACMRCYTDHSAGFVKAPGDQGGWVAVLTTWKDLGTGESLDSLEWQSHLAYEESHGGHGLVRDLGAPDVFWAWGGLEAEKRAELQRSRGMPFVEAEGVDTSVNPQSPVVFATAVRLDRLERLMRG